MHRTLISLFKIIKKEYPKNQEIKKTKFNSTNFEINLITEKIHTIMKY